MIKREVLLGIRVPKLTALVLESLKALDLAVVTAQLAKVKKSQPLRKTTK